MQLFRTTPETDCHLDEHTREVGRIGVAQAKAALAACRHVSAGSARSGVRTLSGGSR